MAPSKEQTQKCIETLTRLVELLGFSATITGQEGEREIVLDVDVDEPGRFIGKGGQYITNLELVLNRVLQCQEGRYPYVSLNVAGCRREPREARGEGRRGGKRGQGGDGAESEQACRQALDAAKEVKKWGEAKTIGPFGGRDRRAIHLALEADSDVVAVSGPDEGRGMKKITIALPGRDQAGE